MPRHGQRYECDHPAYSCGTLYFENGLGLVVIQQRYNPKTKHTWWDAIDAWLVEEIYQNSRFKAFFSENARRRQHDIYPTFTVRQVMWALRMKPLARKPWETVFDRKPV